MPRIDWFRLNRVLHRDVGYLVCVLTALYAISGIAVNHIADWNPNLAKTVVPVAIGPLDVAGGLDGLERQVVQRVGLDPGDVRGRHRPNRQEFRVFLEHGGEVRLDVATGQGTWTRIRPRTGLFEANVLHLNHLKGLWTWIADLFSFCLLFLAVGGVFMLRGKYGLPGRGKWLVLVGVVVPLGFIVYYHATR